MYKQREIHTFTQGNSAFHLVACHFSPQGESQRVKNKYNVHSLPNLVENHTHVKHVMIQH